MMKISVKTHFFILKATVSCMKTVNITEAEGGSGVAIFLHESLCYTKQNVLYINCEAIESISIEILNDCNINVPDFEQNKKVKNFVNLSFQFGLVQPINKPTRVTNKTISAFDYIITNSIYNNNIKTAIIRADISDHFPITYVFKLSSPMSSENH